MKVFDFDIDKGVYNFEFEEIETTMHSHPVMEIVVAVKGFFSIQTETQLLKEVNFAIIDSNILHKIESKNCQLHLLMIESYNKLLPAFFSENNIEFDNGLYAENKSSDASLKILSKIKNKASQNKLRTTIDPRVSKCLSILDNQHLEYKVLMETLTSQVFLSESRISHLFKEAIGISLKKYLIWSKLKNAMNAVLKGANLTEAAHEFGFFDQAHLSNTFVKFLGIRPSKEYNSRIIQF